MQILVHVGGGYPTIRWIWSLRCSGCSRMPPGSRCCGHWSVGRCRSTTLPACRKTRAFGVQHLAKLRMARLVRTRRDGTTIFYAWRTITSGNWSPTRCSTPSTPDPGIPGHHQGADADSQRCTNDTESHPCRTPEKAPHDPRPDPSHPARPHATLTSTAIAMGTTTGIATGAGRQDRAGAAGGVRAAQPRRLRQHRRCLGVQRRRYPGGEDQSARRSVPLRSPSW